MQGTETVPASRRSTASGPISVVRVPASLRPACHPDPATMLFGSTYALRALLTPPTHLSLAPL